MTIKEKLENDPNKGWLHYARAIDHAVVDDVEGFSSGLVLGEEIAKSGRDLSERIILQEAIRGIPEDEYTTAFVIGAIQGVITEKLRQHNGT
jgi:hypothetical protein